MKLVLVIDRFLYPIMLSKTIGGGHGQMVVKKEIPISFFHQHRYGKKTDLENMKIIPINSNYIKNSVSLKLNLPKIWLKDMQHDNLRDRHQHSKHHINIIVESFECQWSNRTH